MAEAIACPLPAEFENLIRNRLPPHELVAMLAHLEECASCCEAVAPILNSDTLLRNVSTVPTPALGRQFNHLLLLNKPADTVDTASTDGGEEESDASLSKAGADGRWPQLGPYQILGVLGRGGMGIVFRAIDTVLNRPVALKVMRSKLALQKRARERFLSEARAAAGLRSDHIVTIYQTGEIDGMAYLAMELLEGESLAARLTRGPLPVPDILRIGRETAMGLAAAHRQGLIHRDIKPDNIWLESPKERVKILDFGLARPLEGGMNLTKAGGIVGTPSHMSPEQASGQTVDARSDLFSLGTVLYRMATGRLPFPGENILAVLSALANVTPQKVRSLNPDAPAALDALIMRMLAKDPPARPASANAVLETLTAIEADPTRRSTWNRRRWLGLTGLPLGAAAIGYWLWPKRLQETGVASPNSKQVSEYRELRLPPKATMFVGNFHPDPGQTITIEGFFTFESLVFPKENAQQVMASTCISVFLGGDGWNLGVQMLAPSVEKSLRMKAKVNPVLRRTHVAMVHLGPQLRLYIDGTLTVSENIGHDWKFIPTNWFSLGGNALPMRCDEVRISTVARYTKDFTPVERHEPDELTFALYHLDESDGVVVHDSSGRNRHGTNHSGQWALTPHRNNYSEP